MSDHRLSTRGFADKMDSMRNYVVSMTLTG
jgi:hypothetical protein